MKARIRWNVPIPTTKEELSGADGASWQPSVGAGKEKPIGWIEKPQPIRDSEALREFVMSFKNNPDQVDKELRDEGYVTLGDLWDVLCQQHLIPYLVAHKSSNDVYSACKTIRNTGNANDRSVPSFNQVVQNLTDSRTLPKLESIRTSEQFISTVGLYSGMMKHVPNVGNVNAELLADKDFKFDMLVGARQIKAEEKDQEEERKIAEKQVTQTYRMFLWYPDGDWNEAGTQALAMLLHEQHSTVFNTIMKKMLYDPNENPISLEWCQLMSIYSWLPKYLCCAIYEIYESWCNSNTNIIAVRLSRRPCTRDKWKKIKKETKQLRHINFYLTNVLKQNQNN